MGQERVQGYSRNHKQFLEHILGINSITGESVLLKSSENITAMPTVGHLRGNVQSVLGLNESEAGESQHHRACNQSHRNPNLIHDYVAHQEISKSVSILKQNVPDTCLCRPSLISDDNMTMFIECLLCPWTCICVFRILLLHECCGRLPLDSEHCRDFRISLCWPKSRKRNNKSICSRIRVFHWGADLHVEQGVVLYGVKQ